MAEHAAAAVVVVNRLVDAVDMVIVVVVAATGTLWSSCYPLVHKYLAPTNVVCNY